MAIGLIAFIPLALNALVNETADGLVRRSESTPLLIGSSENTTELTLSSLYFRMPQFRSISQGFLDSLNEAFNVRNIPLYLRHSAENFTIVGTTTDYFEFRRLETAEGRIMALLGECVLGSKVAETLDISIGETIISSPSGAFDIAGSFPLKMTITGILKPSGTADDEAIFTDIKTAWVISGKAHGHADLIDADSTLLLQGDGDALVASAAILSYTEITKQNRDSFHFHGDPSTFPIDALIAVPSTREAGLKLRSALNGNLAYQVVVPKSIIQNLVATLFSVNNVVIFGSLLIGLAALSIAVLVFVLSIRLRRNELNTLRKMGVATDKIQALFAAEIGIILTGSGLLCIILLFTLNTLEQNWLGKWLF